MTSVDVALLFGSTVSKLFPWIGSQARSYDTVH